MNPLISVIVPVYNACNTLDKCINSLLNQTIMNLEIIVVNDGSSDNSLDIINKYKEKIVVINNEFSLGPSISRNKGLDIAKGKYIGFVDADDYVDLTMYEKMLSKMNEEIDLVICSRINVTKNNQKEVLNYNVTDNPKEFSKTTNYIWDKLFKKEIIDKYNLRFPTKYSYAEDFYFGIKYKYYSNKMYIIQKPLYYYSYDSEGSITNSHSNNLMDIIKVLDEILDFFRKEKVFEEYKSELLYLSAGYYVRRIREFSRYKNFKQQRKFVKYFLDYFERNFSNYKEVVNSYDSKNKKIYRSNYNLMLLYILFISIKRFKS